MQAADTDVAQYATQLLLALDLLGIAVFALSGALVAIRSHLDVFRVLVLAYATALAGGVTRDVLISAIPPRGSATGATRASHTPRARPRLCGTAG